MPEIGCHRAEIAVVDPHERGAEIEDPLELALVVELHQRRHTEIEDLGVQAAEEAVVETLGDEEDGVSAVDPRLDHLATVDDELLPQHWQ